MTTVPSGTPRSASAPATSFVEPTSAYQSTCREKIPARSPAMASALARSSGSVMASDPNLEAEVGGGSRMRQRADRHIIGAGLRKFRHPRQRNAAGDLGLRASAALPHRVDDVRRGEIVEQDDVGASLQRVGDLAQALRLDLDRHSWA